MKKSIVSAVAVLAFLVAGCSSGPDMKEGSWEVTVKTEMKGIPMQMPALSYTQCLTKDEMIPQGSPEEQSGCETLEQKTSGDTVSWKVICENGVIKTESVGSVTYSGDTFNGSIKISTSGAMVMEGTTTMSGKHLGPCK